MDNVKKQSYLGPFITMVILMSLVGLITNINQQFQAPMQAAFLKEAIPVKDMLATFINFSFFLAYLLMGNLSANTIQKHGYRSTLVRGLIILLFAFGIFEISALLFDRFPHTSPLAKVSECRMHISYSYWARLLRERRLPSCRPPSILILWRAM